MYIVLVMVCELLSLKVYEWKSFILKTFIPDVKNIIYLKIFFTLWTLAKD